MSIVKTYKKFFRFLQYFSIRILSVTGALLIIVGGLGLFFAQKSGDKIIGLILASSGYILVALISYLGCISVNKKELEHQQFSRREKGIRY